MGFMTFLDTFSDYLTNIINDHKNLIILDDINVHYEDKEDLDKQTSNDLLNSFRLKQWVNCITHEEGHTLDSIIMLINGDLDLSAPENGLEMI